MTCKVIIEKKGNLDYFGVFTMKIVSLRSFVGYCLIMYIIFKIFYIWDDAR